MAGPRPSGGRGLHWLIAFLVLAAVGSGYALTRPGAYSVPLLQAHLVLGASAGLLSLIRVLKWLTTGAPAPTFEAASRLQAGIASVVHILLRLVPLVLLASGAGMIAVSGAISGISDGTLPSLAPFHDLPPRMLHHVAALLLVSLTALHGLAALWHVSRRPKLKAG